MEYTVYRLENIITKRNYIGMTSQNPKRRWRKEYYGKMKEAIDAYPLDLCWKKHIEFKTPNKEQALELEAELMKWYDSVENGYNTSAFDNYKFKRDNKWDLNAYASYNFLKKFTARVDLGYRAQNTRTDRYYGKTAYYSREGDGKTGAGGETGRVSGIRTLNEESRFLERATFEYKDKFNGGHNFSVFVGEEAIINKGEQMVLYGWGYEPTYDGESLFKHLGQYNAPAITQYIDPTDNMLSFF